MFAINRYQTIQNLHPPIYWMTFVLQEYTSVFQQMKYSYRSNDQAVYKKG